MRRSLDDVNGLVGSELGCASTYLADMGARPEVKNKLDNDTLKYYILIRLKSYLSL